MVDVALSYLEEKFVFQKLDNCIKIGEEPLQLTNYAAFLFTIYNDSPNPNVDRTKDAMKLMIRINKMVITK